MREEGNEPEDLRTRTKRFALDIIKLSTRLPRNEEVVVIRRQMLRSGTSPAAQYREACRARSGKEFTSKMESALQELDETALWLELLTESKLCDWPMTRELLKETNELISIFVTIVRKSKTE